MHYAWLRVVTLLNEASHWKSLDYHPSHSRAIQVPAQTGCSGRTVFGLMPVPAWNVMWGPICVLIELWLVYCSIVFS